RHTRCYRDWSSDVCSSDLKNIRTYYLNKRKENEILLKKILGNIESDSTEESIYNVGILNILQRSIDEKFYPRFAWIKKLGHYLKIGRASCRKRVEISL